MTSTFRLGRILGVRVGVNWSVLVVAWLLAWSLASTTLPDAAPGHGDAGYWIAGTLTAGVFLASILAHELGHAYVARHNGVGVHDITIWMFGGIARLKGPARTARAELRIALAGPAVSVAIAVAAIALAALAEALTVGELATTSLLWLGFVNLVLVAFNLIPAAPLDGGRVLSAVLWTRWADEGRAHRAATRVGRWFGTGLILLGIVSFAADDLIGGVWLAFLGWFLITAAESEQAYADARSALGGVRVAEVMSRDPIVVARSLPLDRFIDEFVHHHRYGAYPVIDEQGRVDGIVTVRAIRGVPRSGWSVTRLVEIATPVGRVVTASPDTPVVDVIAAMNVDDGGGRVLVFDDGRLVGIVAPSDISRLMERVTLRRDNNEVKR
jgi:Zn-dependent protease/predicted transcriptional regulator